MIKTKSVYSPMNPQLDGLRVLVKRFRGRGLKKNRYHVWMANLGPSERLFRDAQSGKINCMEFTRRYRAELLEAGSIDRRNQVIKNHGQKFTLRLLNVIARSGTVTLMCHRAEDDSQCHRHTLKQVLEHKDLKRK